MSARRAAADESGRIASAAAPGPVAEEARERTATAARPARRGACPSLTEPMATGDGLLARLVPAGPLTPVQLAGIARAAAVHGNGTVEISARGSLQVRGLDDAGAAAFADEVAALDIAAAIGVPVVTSPLAGLDPTEIADARPLSERLRQAIASIRK